MKRVASMFIAALLVLTLFGCGGSTLPKGNASRIDFVDGWRIGVSSFEYISDNTVKIVRKEDGQVFYVPITSIDMIWVAKE